MLGTAWLWGDVCTWRGHACAPLLVAGGAKVLCVGESSAQVVCYLQAWMCMEEEQKRGYTVCSSGYAATDTS
jgi:hypothetical protein